MTDIDDKHFEAGRKDTRDTNLSDIPVGVENLSGAVPPHESYEGAHLYDPEVLWERHEEKRLVRKTDFYLLSWICFMVRSAQHFS